MKKILIALFLLLISPAHAYVVEWGSTCTQNHQNSTNRRTPTFVWDSNVNNCSGYVYPFDFAPCNNPVGSWATVPLYPQFNDPNQTYSINDAKEIRVTGRVNVSGGMLYLYIRAPGSVGSLSNNYQFAWDDGNISFTMPVAKVNGVASVEYKLVVASGTPSYTVNFVIDGWCE